MPTGVYTRKNKKVYPQNCLDCSKKLGLHSISGLCNSCSQKRNPHTYWLGKKRPDFSKWQIGRKFSKKTKIKQRESHLGKKQSPETIEKRKLAMKRYWMLNKRIVKTDESKLWRNRIEYRLWRESVFARDNWICQKCLERGNRLHPHHIRNFAEDIDLRFSISNGITFCINCHILFHRNYGRKNNNLEQINKFINYDR